MPKDAYSPVIVGINEDFAAASLLSLHGINYERT